MALKKSQQSLKNWTEQEWRTKSGKKSSKTGERYLPKAAIENLTDEEYAATTAAKRKGTKEGKQTVAQPKKIAEKTKQYRTMKKGGKAKTYKRGGKVSNYDLLSIPAGPERQAALAQYLSFSSNDINSIGVKNIQLGQFYEEGGKLQKFAKQKGKKNLGKLKKNVAINITHNGADTQGQAIPGARIGDKKNQVLPGLTSIRKKKAGDKVKKQLPRQADAPSKQTRDFFSGGAVAGGALSAVGSKLLSGEKMDLKDLGRTALGGALTGAGGQLKSLPGKSVKKAAEEDMEKGGKFKDLVRKLMKKGKSKKNAQGIAAIAGRKKYGPKKFAAMGRAGRSGNA